MPRRAGGDGETQPVETALIIGLTGCTMIWSDTYPIVEERQNLGLTAEIKVEVCEFPTYMYLRFLRRLYRVVEESTGPKDITHCDACRDWSVLEYRSFQLNKLPSPTYPQYGR